MPQDCICPKDEHGVVTQYLPGCPAPGHGAPPPRTNWPPPPSPCLCTYSPGGTLQVNTACPLHGGP